MTTINQRFLVRGSVLAVRAGLLALALLPPARAAEPLVESIAETNAAIEELTQQSSSVELGIGYVGTDSYKYGEYNGLGKDGPYAIGNIDLRGGGRFDSDDPTRWRLQGSNLGLDTRHLRLEYGRQGSFDVRFDYDELRRNRSDSYQTPYLGAGSTMLTLPANWVVPVVPRISGTTPNARGLAADIAQSNALVSGVSTAPTPAQLLTSTALRNADLPAFHQVDLHTTRKRGNLGFNYLFNEQWEFKASFRHEDKEGLKPMGMVSRQTGGDITAIMPDLIDQSTEQWDIGLHYTGERSFLQMSYYGSLFTNHVDSMTWQNWATLAAPRLNTISSAPSNLFNQLNLTGGHDFSSHTRLVIDAAYGRASQNESFLSNATTPVVPVTSANALIVSKTLNFKLTARPLAGLHLAAAYKFDERDNRTPVNTYQFSDANQAISPLNTFNGAVVAQNANANQPYSKRVNKFDVDADYRLGKAQFLKGAYEFQKIDRWCDGSWITCVDAATTKENTVRLEYRNSMLDNLSGRLGIEHGQRTVGNYNENAFLALVPYANQTPTGAPGGATAYGTMLAAGLNGWGPYAGVNPAAPVGSAMAFFFSANNALSNALYANENRISELPGMRRYNMADRQRDKLRTGLNWQVNEQWSLQTGVNFNKDDYQNSVYGLKESSGWSFNLDANYQASEKFSINAFYTYEALRAKSTGNTYTANSNIAAINGANALAGGCYGNLLSRNQNNKIDPCNDWSAELRDRIDTLGIAFKHKGLYSGKLLISGDLSVTRARSDTRYGGGNYVNNPQAGVVGAGSSSIAAFYLQATPLPTVSTKTLDLRLVADYVVDKKSTIRAGYQYSRLRTADWAYDGMQPGGLTQMLPSNEQSPHYTVHAIGISYILRFR